MNVALVLNLPLGHSIRAENLGRGLAHRDNNTRLVSLQKVKEGILKRLLGMPSSSHRASLLSGALTL